MALSKLGARGGFASLGSTGKATAAGGGGTTPNLVFSVAGNSQYQPLVISLSDDPYENIDPNLLGVRWRGSVNV